jgi:nitrogen fixation protein FixH
MNILTGRKVVGWLGGFFGVIFATNAIFITEAVKTFRGEDEQKPYLQGVEYNRTLANRTKQAKLGWRASIAAQRSPQGPVTIRVELRHADGSPETGARLAGELRHPADENRDRQLRFRNLSGGRYETSVQAMPGAWDVLVSNLGETPFKTERRLWLR